MEQIQELLKVEEGGAGGAGNDRPSSAGAGGVGLQAPPTFRNPAASYGTPGPSSTYFWFVAGGGGGGNFGGAGGAGGTGGGGTGADPGSVTLIPYKIVKTLTLVVEEVHQNVACAQIVVVLVVLVLLLLHMTLSN